MKAKTVVTIGSFDGVHRGHQALLRQLRETAQERGIESVVVTFDRQPREVFDPTFRPELLSTLDEKCELLADEGVDRIEVLPFTRELAAMSAREFMASVLRDSLGAEVLLTGYDNRFGHRREEGFEDYVRYGRELGIEVMLGRKACFESASGSDACNGNGQTAFSSSAIRQMLREGHVDRAAQVLSRPYRISGHIVAGEHIGHGLGFPTANLEPDDVRKMIPADGAYAVWASIDGGEPRAAMMNIGTRPTFDGQRRTLEVHVLSDVGNVYGRQMSVDFVERLREERRFENPEALADQLRRDREMTEKLLLRKD